MVLVTKDMKLAKVDDGFKVTFSNDNLKAFLVIDSEKVQPDNVTEETIIKNLQASGITNGIDPDAVTKIVADKEFDVKHEVAKGTEPEHGHAASFELCFETERKVAPKEGDDGRIDYRDMDFLLNAEPGQVLVKKIPPTEGKPGKDVFGNEISAKPGKDKNIPKGANTELSSDGMTLSASKAGTIVYAGSVVSVQPVTTISASVDLSTGNINCKGSLKVMKNITSDMKVLVEGDMEVCGNVEDAEIVCKGNVVIKGGFIGRGDGVINAGGDVTMKYIINQTVNSRGNVTIGGEAVNSRIHARDWIDMIGAKGKIVGGHLTARKRIKAMILGADAGTKTVLKVAYDPKLMEMSKNVLAEITRLKNDEERVKAALVDLYRLKMNNKLPPKKLAVLAKLEEFKKSLPNQFEELKVQQQEIDKKLNEIKDACVIAEREAYTGVQVHIGRQYKEIDTKRGPTIFEMYGDSIIVAPFDKNAFEAKERAKMKKKSKE